MSGREVSGFGLARGALWAAIECSLYRRCAQERTAGAALFYRFAALLKPSR